MGIARQFVRVNKPAAVAPPKTDAKDVEPPPTKRGRGRPSSGKVVTTLRLDPDVIAGFKASGEGWQSRINQALRRHLGL